MEIGLVRKVDIDHEMQQSYLDYAMSVIVSRALPDARDGLKPVQRRILYAMYDMGLRVDSSYKKSARIVGEVLGKYHPHGDMAVYEAMARLAQDFTMRYPEVDGQGNFGSIDGDPPAAMRYTEARLMPFAMDLLAHIDRNTVDFEQNFDGTLNEPLVLPAAAPNLLVNGANGIAVGMATSIPPHNLGEVVDALTYMLRHWDKLDDVSITDLMRFVKGPDFPTGGIILQESDKNELLTAYATGRGRVTVRGRVHVEEMGRGRDRLIISELPYQSNKSTTIERIAELVREGELDGIADLRDESDRQGMRIVIELNKAAETDEVLRQLYRRTPLQSTFSINMLALVDGEPRLLSLRHALRVYLEHRLEVIRRRSQYDLERSQQRAHILEGLRVAISHLDEVIALIRNSPDSDKARSRLMSKYKLSEAQAQAILDMPLKRLAALERKKIEQEYKELLATIKELEALLRSPKKLRQQVENELVTIKETYSDRRRTQIVALKDAESATQLLTTTDLTPAKETWVGIMPDGTVARTHGGEPPRLSGRQAPRWILKTDTHHTLYLVSENGRAAAVAVQTLPEEEGFAQGVPLTKVTSFEAKESLAAVFSLPGRNEL
ncbi:MAG: DNA topoisomerase 4 subunit A, partial [Chloroflexi bacterium]|nr:DNA topoisomerase 4 subunit A [Chloroflexota bacterium]